MSRCLVQTRADDLSLTIVKYMYAVAVISLCAIAISKSAMLFFHLRITPLRAQRITCYVLAGVFGLWMVVVMALVGTRCGNKTPWALYGRTCHTYVSRRVHQTQTHVADTDPLPVGTVDWHRHHRLHPRASDLRGPRLDSLPHSYTTQLQEHDPDCLCLATPGRNLRRHPRLYHYQLGHDNSSIRPRRSSFAIPLAEHRDKLCHHGRHFSHSRPLRQVSQHEMGRFGWA
jgi:hypothetical protein